MKPSASPRSWVVTIVVGFVLFGVFMANGREIACDDTEPTRLLTYALIRGDGPYLDRFRDYLEVPGYALPAYVGQSRGHLVSRYPVTPALLAAPIAWPTV